MMERSIRDQRGQGIIYLRKGRLSFQATCNNQKTKSFLAFVPITTALIIVIIMAQ